MRFSCRRSPSRRSYGGGCGASVYVLAKARGTRERRSLSPQQCPAHWAGVWRGSSCKPSEVRCTTGGGRRRSSCALPRPSSSRASGAQLRRFRWPRSASSFPCLDPADDAAPGCLGVARCCGRLALGLAVHWARVCAALRRRTGGGRIVPTLRASLGRRRVGLGTRAHERACSGGEGQRATSRKPLLCRLGGSSGVRARIVGYASRDGAKRRRRAAELQGQRHRRHPQERSPRGRS